MTRSAQAPLTAIAALVLVLGLFAAVSPVAAGNHESGEVVFRVTLEGDVPPTHAFGVLHECNETCSTDRITMVCSSPQASGAYELCAAGTYEVTLQMPVGLAVEYALVRWTSPDHSVPPEEYLHGSWMIHEGRQVISLGFDYSEGGSPAPGTPPPSAAPMLPDTAFAAP